MHMQSRTEEGWRDTCKELATKVAHLSIEIENRKRIEKHQVELLRRSAQTMSWDSFGDCRAFGNDSILPTNEIVDQIKVEIGNQGTFMAHTLLHNNGAFNFYSTIADGPIFMAALTLEQVHTYIGREHGEVGLRELGARIKRALATGTSSHIDKSLSEFLSVNRAGPNETKLSTLEFIEKFLTL